MYFREIFIDCSYFLCIFSMVFYINMVCIFACLHTNWAGMLSVHGGCGQRENVIVIQLYYDHESFDLRWVHIHCSLSSSLQPLLTLAALLQNLTFGHAHAPSLITVSSFKNSIFKY